MMQKVSTGSIFLVLSAMNAKAFTFQNQPLRGVKTATAVRPSDRRNLQDDFVCLDYMVDFNEFAPGTYITDQLFSKYGITIHAENKDKPNKVYVPNGAVRVFDTANPGTNDDNGDVDLGAPNEACPDGGPGIGEGGGPNAEHPNCKPLGNVIVIQESNKIYPDDAKEGGDIYFDFQYPVVLMTLGLLDIEEKDLAQLTTTYSDDTKAPKTWDATPSGDNGYFSYPILNQEDVSQFKVHLPGSGALAHVEFRMCRPEPDVRDAGFEIPDDGDDNDGEELDECPEEEDL